MITEKVIAVVTCEVYKGGVLTNTRKRELRQFERYNGVEASDRNSAYRIVNAWNASHVGGDMLYKYYIDQRDN